MQINHTVPYFLENYDSSIVFLNHYHQKFTRSFEEYFLYHCSNKEQKMEKALVQYPLKMSDLKKSSDKIERLIKEVVFNYQQRYEVEFTKDVHIIVGLYGSNAFTERQVIPEVTFCLEKLSAEDEHLKVIIAHEFGHVVQNLLSDQENVDWLNMKWSHPYTMLFQEGSATYFSEQVVRANQSVYFSYDDNGQEWLQFAEAHKRRIVTKFVEDVKQCTDAELFREWFSINGGSHFGFTRLAYYIGYEVIQVLLEQYSEREAITLWKRADFHDEIEFVLSGLR